MLLKLSTATTVTIGPVLDADGVAVTTAVLADFSIAKNGSVATLTGATVTHSTNGYYLIALTVSNTNSLGRLDIIVNNSAMSMSNHRYDVLPSDTYEELMTTGIADAVWDEPYAGHTTAGSFGKLIDLLRKANMVVEGTVLASPTPTTTTFNVSGLNYPTGAFEHAVLFFADDATLAEQNSPILTFVNNGNGTQTIVLEEARTAAPIAGDTIFIDATSHVHAIVDIQAGLATSSGVTSAFTEIKGAAWSSGTDTLEKIRDASGGSNITITPLSSTVEDRVNETTIRVFLGENITVGPIAVFDSTGGSVDLSATCEIVISRKYRGDILIIPNGSISRSGVNNNQFSFSSTGATLIPGTHSWALRRVSDNFVFAHGDWIVKQVATKD
jgi:hypothetical protein